MAWQIQHGKKWDNIEERAVYWLMYLVRSEKTTPGKLEKTIDWIKKECPNKRIRIGKKPFDKDYCAHIKYTPEVI